MGRDVASHREQENIVAKKPSSNDIAKAFPGGMPHCCVDKELSVEQVIEAAERAIEERPSNAGALPPLPGSRRSRFALAAVARKLWKPGRVLKVGFVGGHEQVRARVRHFAKIWEQFANITFDFGNHANPEIRIAFDTNSGSWSYLGTDNLGIPSNEPTMNYGWLTPDSDDTEYERVVCHEFGHALGCIHEHQNPNGSIPWDREKAYLYYMHSQGWTREQVDVNIFQTYSRTSTNASDFDPHSIMLYPIDDALTIGTYSTTRNTRLSELDKIFIATQYPRAAASVPSIVLNGPSTPGAIGAVGEVDEVEFTVPKQARYRVETAGKTDVVLSIFGPNDPSKWVAEDDDSGVGTNSRITMNLAPGKYIARVRHYGNGMGAYAIVFKSM
jgi:Astacin (Peptidase family M12A)